MKTQTKDAQAVDELDREVMALAQAAFRHARAGETLELGWLIFTGVPVNLTNERGDTLLMLTSYLGHVEATRMLLEHRADPERLNDRGQNPLSGAAFKGSVLIAQLLLEHGAQVDGAGPDGKTALMYAAMFDRLELLELLLSRGAQADRRDAAGRTALDYARATGASSTLARLTALKSTGA